MGFAAVDYVIVAVYLVGVTLAGVWIAGRQTSSRDYFLGGKDMAWWSVGFSIVASETSTLTFISVPGLAYRGNMHFLQLAFGYFIGRLLVSVLFIPAYYQGDLETAYDFLGRRFGLVAAQDGLQRLHRDARAGVGRAAVRDRDPGPPHHGPRLPGVDPAHRRLHARLHLPRRAQGRRGDGRRADVHLPARRGGLDGC